jgi:OOP family OmpA-OmpF porin
MTNKFKRIILAIGCFALTATRTDAQEINVWANGGWQGLSYKVQDGDAKLQTEGSLGLGYTFPISRHWGLIAGVTGGFYGTRATLNNGTYSFDQVDNTGSAFRYDIRTTGYKETQRFFSFGVPLMLQFHTTGSGTQWYINGGGKLLLPFDANVKASAQQLVLSGYYPDFNVEISDLPQHGFGTLQNWQGTTSDKLKTGAALEAETGLSFALSRHTRLYVGLYLEYGLSNMNGDATNSPLVPYNPNGTTNVQSGSVLNTTYAGDAKLLSYGLQIKLGFGHGKSNGSRTATRPAPQALPQPPIPHPDSSRVPDTVRTNQVAEQPKQLRQETQVPQQPQQTQVAQLPGKPGLSIEDIQMIQQPVTFGILGKTDLPGSVKPHLDEVANILNKYPDVRMVIIGHTCSIGTVTENIRVGLERAKSVAAYLQSKGVDPRRMDIKSEGEANPALPNDIELNRSMNRRVTILYLSATRG